MKRLESTCVAVHSPYHYDGSWSVQNFPRFLSWLLVCRCFNYSYLFFCYLTRNLHFFILGKSESFQASRVSSSPAIWKLNSFRKRKISSMGIFLELHFRQFFPRLSFCLPCAGYLSHEVYMKSFCNLHKKQEPSLKMSFKNRSKELSSQLSLMFGPLWLTNSSLENFVKNWSYSTYFINNPQGSRHKNLFYAVAAFLKFHQMSTG